MIAKSRSLLAAAVVLIALAPAATAEVTLKSTDGSVTITGTLLAFENETYTVRSPVGQVRIQADLVECLGAECPKGDDTGNKATPPDRTTE